MGKSRSADVLMQFGGVVMPKMPCLLFFDSGLESKKSEHGMLEEAKQHWLGCQPFGKSRVWFHSSRFRRHAGRVFTCGK